MQTGIGLHSFQLRCTDTPLLCAPRLALHPLLASGRRAGVLRGACHGWHQGVDADRRQGGDGNIHCVQLPAVFGGHGHRAAT